uniref:Uncharacterized protein n=1 Tax=Globodera pallida TaxID=36090 RepID=A0A183C2D3_GLOPA
MIGPLWSGRGGHDEGVEGEDMTKEWKWATRHDSTNRQRPRPNDVMCLVVVLQCGGCTTDEADIAPRAETI